MKRLVLIDGNSLIHRAYHALPPLTSPKGEPVNAVYGFATMLLRVLQELKPEYIALTFDLPGPTFRHLQYVGYKANRPAADSDLVPQFGFVRELTKAFNIPIFEVPSYEADDLIGTLSRQAEEQHEDLETIIVSGDMDTLQLVDDKTKVFTPRKGISDTILYDIKQVHEKYGFAPHQLIDYKGLRGDTSDNIPGVPGVGEKTAMQLVQQYGSLEDVYKNIQFISGKLKERLAENAEQAKMSKELATIDRNAPIKLDLAETVVHDFDRKTVLDMFQRFGFRSLVHRLNDVLPDSSNIESRTSNLGADEVGGQTVAESAKTLVDQPTKTSYKLVTDEKDVRSLAAKLEKAKVFGFDTETTSWRPIEATLVGMSFAYRTGEAFYVPFSKKNLEILTPVLENPNLKKIGHNIKFDALVLENHGVNLQGISFDTMIAAWLTRPGTSSLGLKNIAYEELGVQMTEITELIGKGKSQISMAEVPVEQVANYAAADADMTFRLKSVFEKKLRQANVWPVFTNYEMPLVNVLKHMERTGVLMDCDFLAAMSQDLAKEIEKTEKAIYDSVGHEFNIASPKQLSQVLFEELHLPTQTKTKTGFSTDEFVLQTLKDAHPMVAELLKYREYTKLKSTYVDALPQLVDQTDKRVHTNYNQTVASSGRLSSQDPNLQNIPVKTELGAKIRQAFVAPKGSVFLAIDYSQIELRILAHLSQDPVLLKAFKNKEDIHSLTASVIYGVPQDKVTKDMRRVGKTMNFALMYGMSSFGLSQSLGLSRADAQAFIERYFSTYEKVKTYFEKLLATARETGYVETISGRKRYLPELLSHMQQIRRAAERVAVNLPMQGTNADIIKLAMITIDKKLQDPKLKTKMILQVHDELVFEVAEEMVDQVAPELARIMTHTISLSVPIEVEAKVGKNWGEMKPLE